MRGNPSQWTVGSLWLGDGGVYPGMGDSVGLAGTSPELVEGGLWNDGGGVGDPPYDYGQGAAFDSSIGASDGSVGGGMTRGGGGGGSGDLSAHIFAGAVTAIVLGGGVYYIHHRTTNGQKGHSPIKWTAGEVALVTVSAALGLPAFKAVLSWAGAWIPLLAPVSDYVNGS